MSASVAVALVFFGLLAFAALRVTTLLLRSFAKGKPRMVSIVFCAYSILGVLWICLLCATAAGEIAAGGTPSHGKIEATHFYVGEHGRYVQVSRNVYHTLSLAHLWSRRVGIALVAAFPVFFAILGVRYGFARVFWEMMPMRRPPLHDEQRSGGEQKP